MTAATEATAAGGANYGRSGPTRNVSRSVRRRWVPAERWP